MPKVTAPARLMGNGEVVTQFVDTTSATAVTYTYPLQQAHISIENNGASDIYITVGRYTDQVIKASTKWDADVSYTAFSIRSDAKSQKFIATSLQNDIESSGEADLVARVQLTEALTKVELAFANNTVIAPLSLTTKTYMTLIDDDGAGTVMDKLKPMSEELGVPFTLAIPVNTIGASGMLTAAQLLSLQNDLGWEVASHSYNHINLRTASNGELEYELGESKKALKTLGLNVQNFVAPFGSNDEPNVRKVSAKHYNCGVTVGYGINSRPVKNQFLGRNALGAYTTAGNDTLAYYKSIVDQAVAKKGWLIWMTHCSEAAHTAAQNQYLRDTIVYAQSLGVEIVTLQSGFEKMGNLIDIEGKMQVDLQGNIYVADTYPTVYDKTQTNESPITSYTLNKISVNNITNANKGNFPDAGVVITSRINTDIMEDTWSYQILYGYTSGIYYRRWKTTGWDPWKRILNEDDKNFTMLTLNTVTESSLPSAYPKGGSMCQVTGWSIGNGIVKTYNIDGTGYERQEFSKASSSTMYTRAWNGTAWLAWAPITPISGLTPARPTTLAVGQPYFDTTLNKPIWLKTAPSTWVDATGTVV